MTSSRRIAISTIPTQWFQQVRDLAEKFGFARNAKEYKQNPDGYPGSIREASQLIRMG